jgi:hypothetical protein
MTPMTPAGHFTAFIGPKRLASGSLADVALAVKKSTKPGSHQPILIFDDTSGKSVDLDLRGTDEDVVARLPLPASPSSAAAEQPSSEPWPAK